MLCERCKKELSGNQKRWCSLRCGKLGLKALYKKRNREKVSLYNKAYRQKAIGGYFVGSKTKKKKDLFNIMDCCQRCGTKEALQCCHIKPHWAGGSNKLHNFIILCQSCHSKYDNALRAFWKIATR